MKKTQSFIPLSEIKVATQPSGFYCVESKREFFDTNKFDDGLVVDKIKHRDFDDTEGNIITQVFMKEDKYICPHCGKPEVKREFILFYTKDSIIAKFWKNIKPYTL